MIRCLYFILLTLCLHTTSSAQSKIKRTPAKSLFPLKIVFENRVDTQLLQLNSAYINPQGEAFTIRNFRYYISRFSVTDTKGETWPLPTAYYLVDERKPESKNIILQIPNANIRAIHFFIGVDSIRNVSGVQAGALDPANGMFWTWNSGYIMAKLEGTSPASAAPQNGFTYHIGGFRKGENTERKVTLSSPESVTLFDKKVDSINITANINSWFFGSSSIKIKEQPFCMNPGKLAMQIADNYAAMFSISTAKKTPVK